MARGCVARRSGAAHLRSARWTGASLTARLRGEAHTRAFRTTASALLRDVALGAWLGLWILGVGGRIAMRAIALSLGQAPAFDAGGTLFVVGAGVMAGAAGALLHGASGGMSRALAGGHAFVQHALRVALFAVLLALVTARGLRGSVGPTWSLWLVVAAYGATLEVVHARRARRAARQSSHAAGQGDFEPTTPAG